MADTELKNTHATYSALAVSRLFEGVPTAVKQSVLGATLPINVKAGMSLFERGDVGQSMFIVKSGRIEISILSEVGRKIVLNQIPPGHCFGEIGMVDGQQRTASAIAIEASVVQSLTRSAFMQASNECPKLAINLMEILCERLRWVSASVEEYALFTLDLRLARRLLSLHHNFGDAQGDINITQNELADYIGATRESTNKLLMHWKSLGILDLRRGKVRITQMEKLERAAHGESGSS